MTPASVRSARARSMLPLLLPLLGIPPLWPSAGQPADAAELVQSCQAHLERDDPAAAAAAARRALALDSTQTEAALCLGAALVMLQHYPEAVLALERVLAQRPDNPDALYGLAEAYAALDDGRAEEMYARLTELHPDDVDVRLTFIEYLWQRSRPEAGNQQMERLLQAHPGQPDVRLAYALELLRQRQFGHAAQQLEQAGAEGADRYRVNYLLGNVWWEAGEIDRALDRFQHAVAIDPSGVPARHELGRLLIWMGQPGAAVPHLEQAAAARESAVIKFDLGRGYEALGQLDAAERAYREAQMLEPALSRAHYARGLVLRRLGRHAEAADALRTYQQLHEQEQQRRAEEKSKQAELDLAWLELRRGRAGDALQHFERMAETPEALLGRATALSRLNRPDEAVRVLERALLLAPDDARVVYLLARERAALQDGARR